MALAAPGSFARPAALLPTEARCLVVAALGCTGSGSGTPSPSDCSHPPGGARAKAGLRSLPHGRLSLPHHRAGSGLLGEKGSVVKEEVLYFRRERFAAPMLGSVPFWKACICR